MNELCAKCKKVIQKGDTTVSVVKGLKRFFYHARCFGAKHLEEQNQPASQPEQKVETPAQGH